MGWLKIRCSYSAFSGWQSVWGVWPGDLGVLSCTWQPERQPCWRVLTKNRRQGTLFNLQPNLMQNWLSQIAENQPGTLLVTIDSKKLSANIESPSLIVQQHSDGVSHTVSCGGLYEVTFQASGDHETKARFDLSTTKSPLLVPLLSFTRRFTGFSFLHCAVSLDFFFP